MKKIIQSVRKFGVEMEVDMVHEDLLYEFYDRHRRYANVVRDSSIRGDLGLEIVTEPVTGEDGASKISSICSTIEELGIKTDNKSCSTHVHLDAPEFLQSSEYVVVEEGGLEGFVRDRGDEVSHFVRYTPTKNQQKNNRYKATTIVKSYSADDVTQPMWLSSNMGFPRRPFFPESKEVNGNEFKFIDVPYIDTYDIQVGQAILDRNIHRIHDTNYPNWPVKSIEEANSRFWEYIKRKSTTDNSELLVMINNSKPTERVKLLMYFYVMFNSLIQAMVSDSRKVNNAYCMPISDFYSLDQIKAIKSYSNFEELWYKEGDASQRMSFRNSHYHDSRYLDINLHSLFNRTNTIEIRLHGATKNAKHILWWTAMHQLIVDSIAELKFSIEDIDSVISLDSPVEEKYNAFVMLLNPRVGIQKYMKRTIKHFSDINID